MNAYDKTEMVRLRILDGCGVSVSFGDAQTLRKAAQTLRRWYAGECGDGVSVIFRNEEGKPFREFESGLCVPIRDLESGALRRLADVCKRCGLSYKVNSDPRGASVWVNSSGESPDYPFGVSVDL
jgi:hypothetical protein